MLLFAVMYFAIYLLICNYFRLRVQFKPVSFHILKTYQTHFYPSNTQLSVACRCPYNGKSTTPFQLPLPLILPFVTGRLRAGEWSVVTECGAIRPLLQSLPSHIFKCAVVNILSHASETS